MPLVIASPGLGLPEHLVGLNEISETHRGPGIAGVTVRMVFYDQAAIGGTDG